MFAKATTHSIALILIARGAPLRLLGGHLGRNLVEEQDNVVQTRQILVFKAARVRHPRRRVRQLLLPAQHAVSGCSPDRVAADR